jgi:hypothetical protein
MLTAMQYLHWMMVAGAAFVVFGGQHLVLEAATSIILDSHGRSKRTAFLRNYLVDFTICRRIVLMFTGYGSD